MKFTSEMILLLVLSIAAVWDFCLYVVPNELVVASLIVGFALNPCIDFLIRAMLIVLLLMPLRNIKLIGAGDVKLIAVMCAYLGIKEFAHCVPSLAVTAGIICIIMLVKDGRVLGRYKEALGYVKTVTRVKKVYCYEQKEKLVMPLSVALLGGYILYLVRA